ncbi:hypothetical protein YC2023_085430 [Brassica napus]
MEFANRKQMSIWHARATRVKTRNHFFPPEPEEATELRRRRRRTTEEPIFTRARTEEPKLVDLRIGKKHRRLQSILQFRLSCMKRSGIFEDKDKLEDAKTKSIGEKNRQRYRARGSRSTKN